MVRPVALGNAALAVQPAPLAASQPRPNPLPSSTTGPLSGERRGDGRANEEKRPSTTGVLPRKSGLWGRPEVTCQT